MKYKKTIASLLIIGTIVGGSIYAFKKGYVEKWLSQVTVPFSFLVGNDQLHSPAAYAVSNSTEPNIANYKKALSPLSQQFNLNDDKRPNLDSLRMTNKAYAILNKQMDNIYGRPHTYISQGVVSGVFENSKGWGPVYSLSAVDDTHTVKTYNYMVHLDPNGSIKDLELLNSNSAKYWPGEISDDYSMANVNKATQAINNLFASGDIADKSIKVSDHAKALDDYYKNGVVGQIVATTNPNQIKVKYYVGTDKGISKLEITYNTTKDLIESID